MNLISLKDKEKELWTNYEKSLHELHIKFAKSNKRFSCGQIIDNGISRILIDNVSVSGWRFSSPPCCVYSGAEYTRNNKPYKSGRRASIRQDTTKVKAIEP